MKNVSGPMPRSPQAGTLQDQETLRRVLLACQPTLGLVLPHADLDLLELLPEMGMGFILVDAEHGHWSAHEIYDTLRLSSYLGIPSIVRTGEMSVIGTALDGGMSGLQVPHVISAEQAGDAAKLLRFPPHGTRGVGRSRAVDYGSFDPNDLGKHDPVLIVQIEDAVSLRHVQEITGVPGVAGAVFGVMDIKATVGHGETPYSEVERALARTYRDLVAAGIPFGLPASDAAGVQQAFTSGATLVFVHLWSLLKAGGAAFTRSLP